MEIDDTYRVVIGILVRNINVQQLLQLPSNSLTELMWRQLTLNLLSEDSLTICMYCFEVYTSTHSLTLHCFKANYFIDEHLNKINMHVSSSVYDVGALAFFMN